MAKVFLDTNYLIDSIHRKPEKEILESLIDHSVYVSTLSFHIYCYTFKIKIPNSEIISQKDKFQLVDFSQETLENALQGPTNDLEYNVQLHSAASEDCNVFLTNDKNLLSMKFFGRMTIQEAL